YSTSCRTMRGHGSMRRRNWALAVMLMGLAVLLAACSGSPAAASAELAAEPAAAQPTQAAEAPEASANAESNADAQPPAAAATGAARTFVIDPARSEARFLNDEVLMGSPKTVVGSTNQVTGAITVDLGDHSLTQIGPIQADARSLETDYNFRNRALRRQILQSEEDAYQFIVYTPTAVEGLPMTPVVGEPFAFSVTGDLQIRDIVQPVTFAVTVTPVSETELQGSARATVQRADFDLNIPRVPSVADVSEEVVVEFDFVAIAG